MTLKEYQNIETWAYAFVIKKAKNIVLWTYVTEGLNKEETPGLHTEKELLKTK